MYIDSTGDTIKIFTGGARRMLLNSVVLHQPLTYIQATVGNLEIMLALGKLQQVQQLVTLSSVEILVEQTPVLCTWIHQPDELQ